MAFSRGRFVTAAAICSTLFAIYWLTLYFPNTNSLSRSLFATPVVAPFDTMPIHVLSLPQRSDRRKEMEHLRLTLGMEWEYRPATDSRAPLISQIKRRVRYIRSKNVTFAWPSRKDDYKEELGELDGTDGLVCAVEDLKIPEFSPSLPNHLVLTPSRIACWHTHASLISRLAEQGIGGIILEDDVDMERDIRDRVEGLWSSLPEGWDVVFFGHCWSDEMRNTPLPLPLNLRESVTRIHPSHTPLCTHAYAVSPTGAQKLDLYLNYPLFAYSRAVDQAFVRLIQTKRITAFSLVPSVIVQRKADNSDIPNDGSLWVDELIHPVFTDERD